MKEYFANPFSDEEDEEEKKSDSPDEPEYSFPGYSIEVNQKIALTPVTPVLKT